MMTGEGEKQKQVQQQLDREIREMISALTRRLADLQKTPGDHGVQLDQNHEDDDDRGVRIITMAGSNVGATMRSELDLQVEKHSTDDHQEASSSESSDHQQVPPLTTYLNSNFQAINNSIMFGGSYSTNDPGIHLDVSDYYNTTMEEHGEAAKHKHSKKGKRKTTAESSKSDQHSD